MDQALSLSHKLFADDITAVDTSVITDTEREYDLQLVTLHIHLLCWQSGSGCN